MEIKRVWAVYFSPTGRTRQLALALAGQLAKGLGAEQREVDFTLPAARETSYAFAPEDLVVFAMPTYAGKLPNKLLPFVQSGFTGSGTPAADLVSFGNRNFDNSLAELSDCLQKQGFVPFAAAAFATQHAFSETLAVNRPDARDLEVLASFGTAILERLPRGELSPAAVPGDAAAPYYTPRDLEGEPAVFLKAKPKTDPALCVHCGYCAGRCPMGSIDQRNVYLVPGLCIKCHACVKLCPNGAKYFDDGAFLSHRAMLESTFTRRAEPVTFL